MPKMRGGSTLKNNSNIIMYITDDGQVKIEVLLENENVWLSQNLMAKLFDTTKQNINLHIKNIYEEHELNESSTVKDYLTVQQEGKRKVKKQALKRAHKEYDKYIRKNLTRAEQDYLFSLGEEIKRIEN
jgi:hypothetical protein